MLDKIRSYLNCLFIALIAAMTIYNGYAIYTLNKKVDSNTLVLTDSINSLSFDTQGKIDNLAKETKTLTQQTNTVVETKEITYVQKVSDTDADVEIKTANPKITVKVNDGERYSFDLLPTESTKMEDGKLLINQAYSSTINIKANEYKRSKLSMTTALNTDKKIMGGLNYDLGNSVAASVFVGQGIKPYFGLTYRIGGYE